MTVMRLNRLRELVRLPEQPPSVGVHSDVPGGGLDDIDPTVERDIVGIRVRQLPADAAGSPFPSAHEAATAATEQASA